MTQQKRTEVLQIGKKDTPDVEMVVSTLSEIL